MQILITFVDFLFIVQYNVKQKKGDEPHPPTFTIFKKIQSGFGVLAMLLSIFQMFIYGGVIPVTIEPERAAHFCEFITEAVNGTFALWYTFLMYSQQLSDLREHDYHMRKMV